MYSFSIVDFQEYFFQVFMILVSYFTMVFIPFIFFVKSGNFESSPRKILTEPFSQENMNAILNSLKNGGILLLFHFILFFAYKNGLTKLVPNFSDLSITAHILLIGIYLFTHDFYFFIIHKMMHKYPILMRYHAEHHKDHNPTPLSTLNFHVVEGSLQLAFFLVFPFCFSMSFGDLYICLSIMFLLNSLGHLPLEFYPKWFYNVPFLNLFNCATLHIQHHQHAKSNFGLYYLWWDKLFGTLSPNYYSEYQKIQENIEKGRLKSEVPEVLEEY